MNTQTQTSAAEEVDWLARKYEDAQGLCYSDALRKVAHDKPDLWARYSRGESEPDPKEKEGAEEFSRRITAYSEHFEISRDEAEKRVREHDPAMKKYQIRGGTIVMDTKQIPLSAESVLAVRTEERLAKGGVKDYSQVMKEILTDDPLLAECYRAGLPYLEASAHNYKEDPMASQVIQAIVEPRPQGQATSTEMPPSKVQTTAMQELGILINGARNADNSPDVALMIQIANMVPQLVRDAASERLNSLAYAFIDILGLVGGARSQKFPEAYSEAIKKHPGLAASASSGVLNEDALREIFFGWFSRDRD